MQDLKLRIKFDFQGKNEIEKLFTEIGKQHNLKIDSNLGQINAEVQNMDKSVKGAIDNMQSWLSKFGFALQGIQQIARGVKAVINETVGLAREQIRAERLVEGAIRATGGAAGYTADELKRMASALQETSNFGDEQILAEVTNVLLTFRNVQGDVFAQAQKAVLDMSAALNQDLQQASIQLGKALQDPIVGVSALRRVGVQLSEQQEQQIKDFVEINDLAKAQGVILDELANQFGGQAENIVDPLIQLKNTMGDIKELIGLAILPGLNSMAGGFRNFLNSITPVKTELEKVTTASIAQQSEFRSLISVYETLRFKQGENVETNEALKTVVEKLNTQFGSYLGNIDLAKIKYDDFRLAVAKATDELVKEATTKKVLAERQDLVDKVGDINYKWMKDVRKAQDDLDELYAELEKKQANVLEKQKAFESAQFTGMGHLHAPALEVASTQYKAVEKQIENQIKSIDNLNDKMQSRRDKAQSELEDFINAYSEVLNSKPVVDDGLESDDDTSVILNVDQLKKDLQALKNSLKDREAILQESFEKQKDILSQSLSLGKINNEEYTADLAQLEQRLTTDLNNLKKADFEADISFAEKKKTLGILSYTELKQTIEEYYNWVTIAYGENSKEYSDALNMMRNANLRFGNELKQEQDDLLKDLSDAWSKYSKMYEFDLISFDELTEKFEMYKLMLEYAGLETDELKQILAELNNEFKSLKDNMPEKEFNGLLDRLEETGIAGKALAEGFQSMYQGLSTALSQMIVEQRSFRDVMKNVWKGIATAVINEINRIIARMIAMKFLQASLGLFGFFGGGSAGAVLPPMLLSAATGGYISGPGTGTSDSIPAMLSNGEYVINAEKTNIFKPFLDFLNYSPLPNIKQAFAGVSLPTLNVPAMPKMAYSTGGYASGKAFNFDTKNLENKLDKMVDRLERIEKKDTNVIINAKLKHMEFAREIKKAQSKYNEVIK